MNIEIKRIYFCKIISAVIKKMKYENEIDRLTTTEKYKINVLKEILKKEK